MYNPRDHEGHTHGADCKWKDAVIRAAGKRRATKLPRNPRERLQDEPTAANCVDPDPGLELPLPAPAGNAAAADRGRLRTADVPRQRGSASGLERQRAQAGGTQTEGDELPPMIDLRTWSPYDLGRSLY